MGISRLISFILRAAGPPDATSDSHKEDMVFHDVTTDADVYGETTRLDEVLALRLKRAGSTAALVIAMDARDLVLQSRTHVLRVPRATIRHLSVHPVLPAKSSGMVVLVLGTEAGGQRQARTLAMTSSGYRKSDLEDMVERARRLASLLDVPFSVEKDSYDC